MTLRFEGRAMQLLYIENEKIEGRADKGVIRPENNQASKQKCK